MLKDDIINEFTRLVREILRNCKTWSKATFLRIEISQNCVILFDNSGSFFDIFNPSPDVKLNGGGKTARIFTEFFKDEFTFSFETKEQETYQIFKFNSKHNSVDVCTWYLHDLFQLWEFQREKAFEIPESCDEYTIRIPHGGIDLSTIYISLKSFVESSLKSGKKITIYFSDKDKLKGEFIKVLESLKHLGAHQVIIK